MPSAAALLVAFVTSLLFFLQLRIADEFKDYEDDARYRPYRAGPARARDAARAGVGRRRRRGRFSSRWRSGWSHRWSGCSGSPGLYLALMTREFFAARWLKRHPVVYMTSHMVILPLVDLYATACDWWVAGPSSAAARLVLVSRRQLSQRHRDRDRPQDPRAGGRRTRRRDLQRALGHERRGRARGSAGGAAHGLRRLAGRRAHRHRGADAACCSRRSWAPVSPSRVRVVRRPTPGSGKSIELMSGVWTRADVPRSRRRAAGVSDCGGEQLDSRRGGGRRLAARRRQGPGARSRGNAPDCPCRRGSSLSAGAFAESLTPEQRTALEAAHRRHALSDACSRPCRSAPAIVAAVSEAVRQLCAGRRARGRPIVGQRRGRHRALVRRPARELPERAARPTSRRRCARSGGPDSAIGSSRTAASTACRRCRMPPAVLVQRMVSPRAAGVAFSADPVSGRRGVAVVSAVPGLGSALVSGEADADTWLVDRAGRSSSGASCQASHARGRLASPSGVRTATFRHARGAAGADRRGGSGCRGAGPGRGTALRPAAGHRVGDRRDRLVLLQSRPITSLRAMADPDARLTIWDNSNIVESYSGVTTPLTFSFAREIYEDVYRQFCRMMGVPERVIAGARGDLSATCSGWSAAASTTTC